MGLRRDRASRHADGLAPKEAGPWVTAGPYGLVPVVTSAATVMAKEVMCMGYSIARRDSVIDDEDDPGEGEVSARRTTEAQAKSMDAGAPDRPSPGASCPNRLDSNVMSLVHLIQGLSNLDHEARRLLDAAVVSVPGSGKP